MARGSPLLLLENRRGGGPGRDRRPGPSLSGARSKARLRGAPSARSPGGSRAPSGLMRGSRWPAQGPACLVQLRVKEAKARDGLWLQGWETGLGSQLGSQWVPASDTWVPSQQASLRGHPRASHCRAGGYFEGISYKLSFTLEGSPSSEGRAR